MFLTALVVIGMIIVLAILIERPDLFNIIETMATTIAVDANAITTITRSQTIITQVGTGGANGDPPYQSYTSLNDPLRNIGTSGIGGACDNGPLFNTSIGGQWIRFEGVDGTKMPQTSPGINHCGAFSARLFNGSLPMTNGTRVNGYVCLSTYIEYECIFSDRSAVVNCGDFYVYFLRRVIMCNALYCTV